MLPNSATKAPTQVTCSPHHPVSTCHLDHSPYYLVEMKFSVNLFTLSLLQAGLWSASAFTAPLPKSSSSTALFSSIQQSSGQAAVQNIFDDAWDKLSPPVTVQGGALRTWSFPSAQLERVYYAVETEGPPEGNPAKVDIYLGQGPDNTPQIMNIYSGKGALRPIRGWIETPGGASTIFIRNQSPLEFPVKAVVGGELKGGISDAGIGGLEQASTALFDMCPEQIVQGGAIRTYPLEAAVNFAKIILYTDGRPLNAMVELVQGPNAPKYTIQIYTEDGLDRPFIFVMEAPGAGNVVRVINTATMEFPLIASVGPMFV